MFLITEAVTSNSSHDVSVLILIFLATWRYFYKLTILILFLRLVSGHTSPPYNRIL
jgi:hypothetical protein